MAFERTKLDIEARSQATKEQMMGKVVVNYISNYYNELHSENSERYYDVDRNFLHRKKQNQREKCG